MDWDVAIERNRAALKRIVAALIAMAGLGDPSLLPLAGEVGRGGTQWSQGRMRVVSTEKPTLPRRLHRAVLRLLRPAEADVSLRSVRTHEMAWRHFEQRESRPQLTNCAYDGMISPRGRLT